MHDSLRARETLDAFTEYEEATTKARRTWTFEKHSWSGLYIRKAIFDLAIHIFSADSRFWRLFGQQGVQIERPVEWLNRMRSQGGLTKNRGTPGGISLRPNGRFIPGDGQYPRSYDAGVAAGSHIAVG